MPIIPILTDDFFRILLIKESNPNVTAFEIAAKVNILAQDVCAHLQGLRHAKLLSQHGRYLRLVK